MIHNTFNMAVRDMPDMLPDMHAQSLRAAGQRAEGIHIRQIPHAHVTTIISYMYVTLSHFRLQESTGINTVWLQIFIAQNFCNFCNHHEITKIFPMKIWVAHETIADMRSAIRGYLWSNEEPLPLF